MRRTVKLGEDITLECSSNMTTGSREVWIQLCPDWPSQFITQNDNSNRFKFSWNGKMNCFNLQIINISGSDACLYYDVIMHKTAEDMNTFGSNHAKVVLEGKARSCCLCNMKRLVCGVT